MKLHLKAAQSLMVGALAFAGASLALSLPANAQGFGLSIGPRGGVTFSYDSGGYCDAFGCPDNFWDMPVYYGPVFFDGAWYDGPVYYRDWYGRRQYWIHGGWRFDQWRGPRPGWWREGRYGPPLGAQFYRDHGFHGRWTGPDRGGPGFGPRDDRRDFHDLDRRDGRHDFGPRDDHRGPDPRQQPQAQPQHQPPQSQNKDRRGDRHDDNGGDDHHHH